MSLSDLASIASVISGGAVLISLVYLGLQTRQNAKHTMALIQQGRTSQANNRSDVVVSDPSLTDAVLRGAAGDQSMDDVQAARYVLTTLASFMNWEDQFYQHRDGLIDDTRHAGLKSAVESRLSSVGGRAAWKLMRERFDPSFQKFMNDAMGEVGSIPSKNLGASWKILAAAELSQARE